MPHAVYMPLLYGQGSAGQGDACGMNERAAAFAEAWMGIVNKPHITCHPLCTEAAQRQADWLALHDFDKRDPHWGENGSTANQRLVATGFRLPEWMGSGNVVESATRTWDAPAAAARDLAAHSTHREHMLFAGWWEKWGFNVYGVGAAEAQLERGGVFYVAITGVEGD